ncbi:hypothetical protein LIA77_03524 [Sarocladium implicatum]|nr:hypothetical protein LIA77_03524 [Sarocladium implicatum]
MTAGMYNDKIKLPGKHHCPNTALTLAPTESIRPGLRPGLHSQPPSNSAPNMPNLRRPSLKSRPSPPSGFLILLSIVQLLVHFQRSSLSVVPPSLSSDTRIHLSKLRLFPAVAVHGHPSSL